MKKSGQAIPLVAQSNAKAVGRPPEPRLEEHAKLLKKTAQVRHGSLDCFYKKAEKLCSELHWTKELKSIKRTFEKALNENGPFSWQLQEIYERLVGLPSEVKTAVGFISVAVETERSTTALVAAAHVDSVIAANATLGQPASMEVLHSFDSVKGVQLRIVSKAKTTLSATGSWSRNVDYFRAIEERLRRDKSFRYYRVLCGPPKASALVEHLKQIISIRDPDDHEDGRRTLCIGVTDIDREPERLLVANESETLIALPSVNRLGDYDTALVIQDPKYAECFGKFVHEYFLQSQKLTTKAKVLAYLKDIQPRK